MIQPSEIASGSDGGNVLFHLMLAQARLGQPAGGGSGHHTVHDSNCCGDAVNSVCEIAILSPVTGEAMVRGGRCFPERTVAVT